MEKVNKELRDELFELRLKLKLAQMESDNSKIDEIEHKIIDVRKKIAKDILEQKEDIKNGKSR